MFRTCRGFTKGCFAWSLGVEFAFEAEIMAIILAIKKAHEFSWNNLWVESDSLYVVNLCKYNIEKIPWLLLNKWKRALRLAKDLNVVVSQIFWEDNCVADKLANKATLSNDQLWCFQLQSNLATLAYRDIVQLAFYRFKH